MKAIVVDDERRTRETLAQHLRWQSFGFDTVMQAEDGLAALELAQRTEPDLILTDIMMPRMNGIQLASEIRDRYPRCKLIFISAHSEKSLLKSAIQLQVVDYVEKPLDLESIEQVIRKTASALMEEKKANHPEAEKMKIVMDLCHRREDVTSLEPLLSKHGFPRHGRYATVILHSEDGDLKPMHQILHTHTRQQGLHMVSHLFDSPDRQVIAHIGCDREQSEAKLHALMAEIHREFRHASSPLFIAIGKTVDAVGSIADSFQSANRLLLRRFFSNDQCLVDGDNPSGSPFVFDKQIPEQLFKLIQNKDKEQAHTLVEQFVSSLGGCASTEISSIRNAFYSIIVRLEPDEESPDQYVWELVASIPSVARFQQYLERLIDRIIEQSNRTSDTAAEISDYITTHLHDYNLGVSSIAQHLFLTPSYICSVFKKSTSKSIHQFITAERMTAAKRYLQDPDMLMQEIASRVGFYDPKYFTKVFKKEAGITPSEYRKKVAR